MTHLRLRFLLAGLLLIGGGFLVRYLVGYKDSFWLEGLYVLSIVFGWMALALVVIVSLLRQQPQADTAPPGAGRKLQHLLRLVLFTGSFLAWLTLLVGSVVMADEVGKQRQAKLLATHPTAYATATVTARRVRTSGRGSHTQSLLITYPAGTTLVHQALPDRGQYEVGQQLRVKYVLDTPDLFDVVK